MSRRPRLDAAGLVTDEAAEAMAVAGDPLVCPFDDPPDHRHTTGVGQRSKDGDLRRDPDPGRSSQAPLAIGVADMHPFEQNLHGWSIDDLAGDLKGHEAKSSSMVEPMQEPCRSSADPAVGVVEHEEATVGGEGGHARHQPRDPFRNPVVAHAHLDVLLISSKYGLTERGSTSGMAEWHCRLYSMVVTIPETLDRVLPGRSRWAG
jgi:hypothetical protein